MAAALFSTNPVVGTVSVFPPHSWDAGTCVARVPRQLRISSGSLVVLARAGQAFLCVSLPLHTESGFRKDSKSHESLLVTGQSPLRLRVDRSLGFASNEEDHGQANGVFSICVLPLKTFSSASGDNLSPYRVASGNTGLRKDARGLRFAEIVFVEPSSTRPAKLSVDDVLARARASLRSIGYVPCSNLVVDPPAKLALFSEDGLSLLAYLQAQPDGSVVIGPRTKIVLSKRTAKEDVISRSPSDTISCPIFPTDAARRTTSKAYAAVRELLEQDVGSLLEFDTTPVTGLLLSGPPGVGKTTGVISAAKDCNVRLFIVENARGRGHGAPARALRNAFGSARSAASHGTPSLVFVDEIDALCPKRAGHETSVGASSAEDIRTVAQLLTLMDGGGNRKNGSHAIVYVVGATNRPNALDPALRRPGRFDREIFLHSLSASERQNLLLALDDRLDEISAGLVAEVTSGFVAADLVQLRNEAFKTAEFDESQNAGRVFASQDVVAHYETALEFVRPSLLRGMLSAEVPKTEWNEIGGMWDVKRRLRMAVEWPLDHSATFKRLGLRSPRGVLLHGPPGCCKTTLVRAMATSGKANFLHMSGADVYSCFLGEAERHLREAFDTARGAAPSILFLDELDALVGKRSLSSSSEGTQVQSRVLSTLLTEMDGLSGCEGVLVVGATNRLDLLDDALLRPGRFDEIIRVDSLSDAGRLEVLQLYTRRMRCAGNVDLVAIARALGGATGAQVKEVCQEAALSALRRRGELKQMRMGMEFQNTIVTNEDFQVAMTTTGCKCSGA